MQVSNQLVLRQIEIASRSDANVVLTGATGTGKTTLARSIHERSARQGKPFVAINLATVHEGTLESELFGHERGAFTGADQRRVGRLELAQGGTVFLDEVGELSPRMQARLLDFLQSRTLTPVGSNREIKLDVRVIAATHRDLDGAIKVGAFREDLLHRLRVIGIKLERLTDRAQEFGDVLHECLDDLCRRVGKTILKIDEPVALQFETYSWPGNIRELRNVLEYAVISSQNGLITLQDLPPWFFDSKSELDRTLTPGSGAAVLGVAEVALTLDYHDCLARFEKQYLQYALRRYRGRINQTARKISLNKTTLIRRIRAYGLHADVALPM